MPSSQFQPTPTDLHPPYGRLEQIQTQDQVFIIGQIDGEPSVFFGRTGSPQPATVARKEDIMSLSTRGIFRSEGAECMGQMKTGGLARVINKRSGQYCLCRLYAPSPDGSIRILVCQIPQSRRRCPYKVG